MFKKSLFTVVIAAFFAVSVFSQQNYLKGYLGIGDLNNPAPYFATESRKLTTSGVQSGFFQLAWAKEKPNGRSREIIIGGMPGSFRNTFDFTGDTVPGIFTPVGKIRGWNAHIQAEFRRQKCSGSKKNVKPYGGWFFNLSHSDNTFNSYRTDYYNQKRTASGLRIGFLVGSQGRLSKRLVLDANAGISFYNAEFRHEYIANPALSKSLQTTGNIRMDFNLAAFLRVGIGYRLGVSKEES